ncbi:glycosyltransferase [Candidatus Thioglobus sp.]|nr:glycosyltransferase [Candidatus Thioglobus sp.]
MKISIIIATINDGLILPLTLDSIFNQTHLDVEVIVVDGLSKDNTVNLLKGIKDKKLSWWMSERDNGIYDAWNKALKHINGEWVLFLGAGDELWNKDVLKDFVDYVKHIQNPSRILYGVVALEDNNRLIKNYIGNEWNKVQKKFRDGAVMLPHQGVFHRSDIFLHDNKFDSSFKISGDYEFLLRVLKNEDAHFIPSFIVSRMMSGGISGGFNNTNLLKESLRARKNNGGRETVFTLLLRIRYFIRSFLIIFFGKNLTMKINSKITKLLNIRE